MSLTNEAETNLPNITLSRGEDQMNQKRKTLSRKQVIAASIAPHIHHSKNLREFDEKLRQLGFHVYFRRDIAVGVIDSNKRKYRFKTLGVDLQKIKELSLIAERLKELEKRAREHSQDKDRGTDFKRKSYE